MKILLTDNTGSITRAVAAEAIHRGMEVWTFGCVPSPLRELGVQGLQTDQQNLSLRRSTVANMHFDIVVDTHSQTREDMETSLLQFRGIVRQYFYISSCQVYQMPPAHWLIDEDAPLGNIHYRKARDIIAAENALRRANAEGMPGVIIRPGMLYAKDDPALPLNSRTHPYSLIRHIRNGCQLIVPGDGSALCSLTHVSDFACALVQLFGRHEINGQAINISSGQIMDWNRAYAALAHAADAELHILHVTSDFIREYEEWDDAFPSLCSHSAVLDNGKLLSLLPDFRFSIDLATGLKECVEWFDADPIYREQADDNWQRNMAVLINQFKGKDDFCF